MASTVLADAKKLKFRRNHIFLLKLRQFNYSAFFFTTNSDFDLTPDTVFCLALVVHSAQFLFLHK